MKSIFFSIFILAFTFIEAQQKDLTIEDVVFNSYGKLAPSRVEQLNWLPETDSYVWVKDEGEVFNLMKSSAKSDKISLVLSLENLNKYIEEAGDEGSARFPKIKWVDSETFEFWNGNNLYSYNYADEVFDLINTKEEDAANIFIAPNNKFVAYTVKNNLVVSLSKEEKLIVTNDDNPGIVNGQTVHRVEFGIDRGIFWSPKSNFAAFYRKDETMVTDYPLVDLTQRPAKLTNIKYPMAGMKSHHVTLGVYDVKTKKTVWLNTGEPLEQYLTCVTWDPSEKYIYIAHLNRDQNHMRLIKYNASTGEPVKTLFEESNEKYVEPEHSLIFLPNDKNKFLWNSKRDNWNHLYLYDTEGNLIKQVTKGKWTVTGVLGFDKAEMNVFISSTMDSPIERHAYKVNIESGKIEKLTGEPGMHKVKPNDNGDFFIDTFNSLEVPGIVQVLNSEGAEVKKIHVSENPIKDYNFGKLKIFSLKSDDGCKLYSRMITPPNFDSSKTYPVIVYVYGGPHVQLVKNSWQFGRYSFWFQKMAENGFIVFTLDNHGSGNRGLEFEQKTFRHLGTEEIKDQMTGVKFLKSLPYVDTTRFGVFGWSYGGFMTTSLMLRTNNAFKVGVGGGAVIDWSYYEVMYTERYMDTPQKNPDGYKEANLLNYVDSLKGKLLLVHGTSDPTVVWQHTLMFVKKAADLNKPLDYFPYPGHGHGIRGKDALHLYTKITQYFLDNL